MDYFSNVADVMQRLADNPPDGLERLVEALFRSWENGGKVVSFGNGGSATDSLHFTTELVARMKEEPIQRPAVSLVGSPSTLTAVSNDWSFEEVFEKQVESMVEEGDVVVGISTSGNSENVLCGIRRAKELGASCFALTGETGGKMSDLDAELIRVPTSETSHVQEAHIACLHWVCSKVDERINQ